MATYLMLAHFTERGIMNVKNTAQRAEEFKLMAIRHGAAVRETFWTLGQYDVVAIVPNASSILLGNVYGWFARIERGVYALTPQGASALARWPQPIMPAPRKILTPTRR